MKTPRKHADIIKAWADGAEIEFFSVHHNEWRAIGENPMWSERLDFRIKPEPKPDVVMTRSIIIVTRPNPAEPNGFLSVGAWSEYRPNIKLTFDGETGKLKSAEVL